MNDSGDQTIWSTRFFDQVDAFQPDKLVAHLHSELEQAKQRRNLYGRLRSTIPAGSVLIFLVMVLIFLLTGYEDRYFIYIGVFYLCIALVFPMLPFAEATNTEIEALESSILLQATKTNAVEQRAEHLFKSHEIELRRYYQQALSHSKTIFRAGIVCIIFGFGVIAATFYFITYGNAIAGREISINDQVVVGSVGVISGILSNFVAYVYMNMFSGVLRSFNEFHRKLVETNHLHFANFLLSKIDNLELREKIIGQLALKAITLNEPTANLANSHVGSSEDNR